MNRLRRFVEALWPEVILDGTPWANQWREDHRRQFAIRNRVFFALCACAYVGHYYLVDVPNQKEPIEGWFLFRMSMATLCVVCIALYFNSRFYSSNFCKWPASIAMALGCYTQAYVAVYFPEAPWIYPYIFVFSSVLVLASSPVKSLLFAVPIMTSFSHPMTIAGVPEYQQMSAAVVCGIVIYVVRTSYVAEIRNFVLTQERDESRRKVIDLGKEFEARLKSFIPEVIARRLESLIADKRKSALEATIEVLKPRKRVVSCLWSDIRGFTEGSRDIDGFLVDSVIPEVMVGSSAVEEFRGIPRKIGDLIFAYYDDPKVELNVSRAILSAIRLSDSNRDMNDTVTRTDIRRFILISTGEAVVGNVGGMNSGVEITALGSPVNFLARLDDATKSPGLSELLRPGDILLSEETLSVLNRAGFALQCRKIDLCRIGVQIRDFEDVQTIYQLDPNSAQRHGLEDLCASIDVGREVSAG